MTILVTGAAGFIGSNFIKYLLKTHNSYKIINLDKLTYAGNLDNLKEIQNNPRYKFVKGDICNEKLVNQLVKNVDAIIHFAAESHVDRSIGEPSPFLETNIFGTYVLLEAAKKNKIKRFLQISTDEVYGSILKGSFTEKSSLNPNSPYSSSKASADMFALSYYTTFGLPVVITRSSNNYGPYQYPEKMIPLFITNLLKNKSVPVYGDGKNVRDWIYVEDNCRGIDLVFHKGLIGEVYNIGGGNEYQNLEITYRILKILNKPLSFIKYVEDRLGHDRRYSLSCAKIKKLGFKPKVNFQQGLEKTIKWYTENKWWWEKLKK